MQRVSAVRLFAISSALVLAACADAPTRPRERAPRALSHASLTSIAPLSFRQVSAGGTHACGVTTSGVAYCWGLNRDGQLGIGNNAGPEDCDPNPLLSLACSTRPVRVVGGLAFRAVAANGAHTCGISTNSRAYCWGDNENANLGIGDPAVGPEICGPGPCSTRPVAVVAPRP